jgi:Xaa-Pro aminopeptidase
MSRPAWTVGLLPVVFAIGCSSPPAQTTPAVTPDDPSIPRPAPRGPLTAPVPQSEPRGLVGPSGSVGIEVYRKRRRALMDKIGAGAALITQNMKWTGDRDGMDYYYLTGIEEDGGALLLAPTAKPYPEVLFLATRNEEGDRWTGERSILPSKALELSTGIARLSRERGVPRALVDACEHAGGLVFVGDFGAGGPAGAGAGKELPRDIQLLSSARERTLGFCKVKDMHGLISAMREVKEPLELELMRKAIAYTAAGHETALHAVHPGAREFEVKDQIEDAFRRAGGRHLSYDSITGSGPNGAVLHYPKDDRVMKDGELIVIDAAAEAEMYAADVTRTLPVGGKFTKEQRDIYEIVLAAQKAGIAAARAGVTVADIDRATRKVVEDAGYYDFYLHPCCHFVGLQVHDSGDYEAPLPVNAVITVEPGIYLPQRGFGVRIEDEILITSSGAEVLTKAIPKEVDDIEHRMTQPVK